MSDELDNRAADLAQIAVFNHCKECMKAMDACEPIKVEITNIKENINELEDNVKEIRADMKGALLWVIGLLVSGLAAFIWMIIQQHFDKVIGG